MTQKVQKLHKTVFHYELDYDGEWMTNCDREGCTDEGICRCGWYDNLRATKVNVLGVVNCIVDKDKTKSIIKYCIHRILTINKAYDPHNWEMHAYSSYYGEEVDGGSLHLNVAKTCDEQIRHMVRRPNDAKRIEYVLNLEYGFLLDGVADRKWKVGEIDRQDLKKQDEHYRKLDQDAVEAYSGYTLPRGVVLRDEGKYRLIDGYHRVSASERDTVMVFIGT